MSARSILVSGVLLAGLGAIGVAGWDYATHWRPSPVTFAYQGIDVSEAQGDIAWPVVATSGATFAYMVATTGTDARDARFEDNWRAAAAAGFRRGAIHVYSLCAGGAAQADAFNVVVPRDGAMLPAAVALDFRDDCATRPEPSAVVAELRQFLVRVEAHTGMPVLLKVSRSFEARYRVTAVLTQPVWAVSNFLHPHYLPRAWRIWQASDVRRIDGIDGPVDWDVVAP